jgi:DNA repair protein RadC
MTPRPLYEKYSYKIVRELNNPDDEFKICDADLDNNDWLIKNFDRDQVTSAEIINALFTGVQESLDREHVWSVSINKKYYIMGVNLVSIGTADRSLVHPKFVYKLPIIQNAAAVVMVHNHPSGDPTPSFDDFKLTVRMEQAGKSVGIPLIDHLVLGADNEFVSIMDIPNWRQKGEDSE